MSAYAAQARAKARLRLGRTVEAAADLAGLLDVCRRYGDRYGEALVLRTIGECALAAGELTDADTHLSASAALWGTLSLPLPRARTLRSLATLRAALGDEREAAALRAEAGGVFTAYEAREARESWEAREPDGS